MQGQIAFRPSSYFFLPVVLFIGHPWPFRIPGTNGQTRLLPIEIKDMTFIDHRRQWQ